jgi:uncharacterized protein YbaR (Trm112 family)
MNNSRYVTILCCPLCGQPVVDNEDENDDKPFACMDERFHAFKETFYEFKCEEVIAIRK